MRVDLRLNTCPCLLLIFGGVFAGLGFEREVQHSQMRRGFCVRWRNDIILGVLPGGERPDRGANPARFLPEMRGNQIGLKFCLGFRGILVVVNLPNELQIWFAAHPGSQARDVDRLRD